MRSHLAHGVRFAAMLCLSFCVFESAAAQTTHYEAAISTWNSYGDVAGWLSKNFVFDHGRQNDVLVRTRHSGPAGLLARSPAKTYEIKTGYCTDAANFAIHSLNEIKPNYKAKYIFIKNQYGQPHHWTAGFIVDGKIMVMDFGAGPNWTQMNGIHGPYDSLYQYTEFLRSLQIKNFYPESVQWRQQFPGKED